METPLSPSPTPLTLQVDPIAVEDILVEDGYDPIEEGLLSPTSKQRYRSGSLQHRCGFGFLKGATVRTKYFRLRDHGLLGYFTQDDHAASLEIMFTLFTTVEAQPPLNFVLKSVDIIQTATWLKVEDPVTFRTRSAEEMEQWVTDIRNKLDLMKRKEDAKTYRKRSMIPAHNADDLVFSVTDDPPYYRTFANKFLLLNEIGEGSFSIVRKSVNRLTAEMCAVKCAKHTPALLEEVAILKQLHHPNIVNLHGVYKLDDMFYIVMDFMADGDLCDKLIEVHRFPEDQVRHIVMLVAQGIVYIHSLNIVHRDIKPENILLHKNSIKLADFGLAKRITDPSGQFQKGCGTPEYAAPELLYGRPYGTRSDLFSLGVVIYVLLFGNFPFTVASAAALQRLERFTEGEDVRDMSCLSPSNPAWKTVSPEAQQVLLGLLVVDPNERMSATDLLNHPWLTRASTTDPRGMNDDDELRVQNCVEKGLLELLTRGLEVLKHNQTGKSSHAHRTILRLDITSMALTWTPASTLHQHPKKHFQAKVHPRTIFLKDVVQVSAGCSTPAFMKSATIKEDHCFSLVTEVRTLDLETETKSQQEYLVQGLSRLVKMAISR
ncbi:unnamed protein product [Aphanomyces euteiches]|uniref:Protein kinase domain-containing protein n=1 Tax=Aphanomyces euteiches TaxID=100861 RepID=A0A6G0XVV2_9STRA|nr:hypothetical protein Ae201684_000721 [Aphanomyces euteiches]KAH9099996.1 hypothetical protein Ae201684P_019001 [Aphanomyces euteiches]KAH9153969.1 hypothetical protein AeRB84_003868 [Aphanomyces euteiches]